MRVFKTARIFFLYILWRFESEKGLSASLLIYTQTFFALIPCYVKPLLPPAWKKKGEVGLLWETTSPTSPSRMIPDFYFFKLLYILRSTKNNDFYFRLCNTCMSFMMQQSARNCTNTRRWIAVAVLFSLCMVMFFLLGSMRLPPHLNQDTSHWLPYKFQPVKDKVRFQSLTC